MKIFYKVLYNKLNKLEIKAGDTIYLGVNLGNIFKNYHSLLFKNNSDLNKIKITCSDILFSGLKKYLGKNGTIIVPTFSFQFIKTKYYNKLCTKSSLGFFENFFFKQKGVSRSNHPIFSISIWGKNKNILNPCGNFSFGNNSPFSNFTNHSVKFVNLGSKWVETCTYVHHLEHLNGFNHRFYKPTTGFTIINNKKIKDTFYNPVRFYKLKSKKAEFKIEKYLINRKKIKTNLSQFYSSSIKSEDIYNIGLIILKKDPSFFMSKKTIVYLNNDDKLLF